MKHRNLKAIKVLKALEKYGCKVVRSTPHGTIVENPKNNQSINVSLHQKELAVWIYNNILKRLEIDKKNLKKTF